MKKNRGITLPELLISLPLGLLLGLLLLWLLVYTGRVYQRSLNISHQARQFSSFDRHLHQAFQETRSDGVVRSSDGRTLIVRKLSGVDPQGRPVWSSEALIVQHEGDQLTVGHSQVTEPVVPSTRPDTVSWQLSPVEGFEVHVDRPVVDVVLATPDGRFSNSYRLMSQLDI